MSMSPPPLTLTLSLVKGFLSSVNQFQDDLAALGQGKGRDRDDEDDILTLSGEAWGERLVTLLGELKDLLRQVLKDDDIKEEEDGEVRVKIEVEDCFIVPDQELQEEGSEGFDIDDEPAPAPPSPPSSRRRSLRIQQSPISSKKLTEGLESDDSGSEDEGEVWEADADSDSGSDSSDPDPPEFKFEAEPVASDEDDYEPAEKRKKSQGSGPDGDGDGREKGSKRRRGKYWKSGSGKPKPRKRIRHYVSQAKPRPPPTQEQIELTRKIRNFQKQELPTLKGQQGPFSCPACPKEFPLFKLLWGHLQHHIRSELEPCPVCSKLQRTQSLRKHVRQWVI